MLFKSIYLVIHSQRSRATDISSGLLCSTSTISLSCKQCPRPSTICYEIFEPGSTTPYLENSSHFSLPTFYLFFGSFVSCKIYCFVPSSNENPPIHPSIHQNFAIPLVCV